VSLLDHAVKNRGGTMNKLSTGDPLDSFGTQRRCGAPQCTAVLSRYNPAETCSVHRGWREQPQTRRRR
jgi:hypothetical protein